MTPDANAKPLAGAGVLVTRPAERAKSLCALIKKHGGEAIAFPVIEITRPGDGDDALTAALQQLSAVDLMVFVSVHAVQGVADALAQHRLSIPATTRVAVAGPKTAAHCARALIKTDFVPHDRIDSEGLLEQLNTFDAAGKNILIFRGQSGRDWLKQALEARGATVRYIESYRRKITDSPVAPLLKRWHQNEIDVVIISSTAVMDALRQLLGPRNHKLLNTTPIAAYSHRIAEYCRETGALAKTLTAKKPTDESVVDAILKWRAT